MDEILASIRRIIESGEERQAAAPARRPADLGDDSPTVLLTAANQPNGRYQSPAPHPAPAAEPYVPAARDAAPRTAEDRVADDLAAALSRPAPMPERAEAPQALEPAALPAEPLAEAPRRRFESPADVLSRLRTAARPEPQAEARPAVVDEIPGAFTPQGDDSARLVEALAPIFEEEASAFDRLDPMQFNGEFDEQEFTVELLATAGLIRGAPQETLREAVAVADPVETPSLAAMPAAQDAALSRAVFAEDEVEGPVASDKPLLSFEIGEQIAASFEDLARVVREEHLSKMDDTVRQMLRPMLQEWLDDNLPGIVERLVREEIERVARGPRR
ncbi:DUF2497 domain-containing protein [Aurantimonas sp. Leaf443]|uniref:PopZ family protein n=1 Tax=Aurantimonas sp. Leaf443 TaxID=1736378 RepID=UPI0006FDBCBD|nr:DUF2497 domain-containing protein [Aurantimonas sp. Leaf443]KQT88497.1 hypothetical protein ASG48_03575 [Aurantimonas sp. Leaf443]